MFRHFISSLGNQRAKAAVKELPETFRFQNSLIPTAEEEVLSKFCAKHTQTSNHKEIPACIQAAFGQELGISTRTCTTECVSHLQAFNAHIWQPTRTNFPLDPCHVFVACHISVVFKRNLGPI